MAVKYDIALLLCLFGILSKVASLDNPYFKGKNFPHDPCDGTEVVVNGTSGSISSPNYPNFYDNSMFCRWRISAPNNTRIEVQFESVFQVEPTSSTGCYDYIEFEEVYKELCGLTAPRTFITPGNVLSISFLTDESFTLQGFSFNWTAIDASRLPEPVTAYIHGDFGQITSPNYPNEYGDFLEYTWIVNGSSGKSILVEFEPLFDMQENQGCFNDYLAISEGSTPPGSEDYQVLVCGYTTPKLFFSDDIYIVFTTDSSIGGAGFSLNYSVVDAPTCDGLTQQNGSSGHISTPLYPNQYAQNMDCEWHVETAENTVIAVRFNANFSMLYFGCFFEYLQVFDGRNSSSVQFQHDFCGDQAPRSFVTTGNHLYVRFVSAGFDFGNFGFSIKWEAEANCGTDQFTCWDGTCIADSLKCDGRVDCPEDIADEASCPIADSEQCGISEIAPVYKWHSRIIGGYDAVKGSWPWQGLFGVVFRGEETDLCGAVLIYDRWVLTAAHCILTGVEQFYIKFGEHDVTDVDEDAEQKVLVKRAFVHPKYDWIDPIGVIYGYDIAVLFLETPVNFTKWVKPICLPKYEVMDGDTIVMTGWGRTQDGGALSAILRQVVAPVVSRERCSELTNIANMSQSIICTGLPSGGANTCQGDSGGPVVALHNGTWVVAGLTSFGQACESAAPGSYANVYNLLPFVNDVISNGVKEVPVVSTVIRDKTSGVISSPNYGVGKYPGGVHLRWYILVESQKLIQIRFNKEFRIEQTQFNSPCAGDYLLIYDGSSTLSRKYGDKRICGDQPPIDLESQSNAVIIEFHSDHSFEDVGFSLSWQAVDACASNELRCWNQTCLPESMKCDGVQSCPSNNDELECGTPGSAECGKSEIPPEFPFTPLIVGGHNAIDGSWPWQVGLYRKNGDSYSFTCGGSLISEYWVLTAAHCIASSDMQVAIGDYNKNASSISRHEKRINVTVALLHPGYGGLERNDIGFLRLEEPVDFTSKWYKPVCLPPKGDMKPAVGATCIITGWGVTGPSRDLNPPDILQQVQVKILNDSECQSGFQYYEGGDTRLICLGLIDRDLGACYGDSGGPLQCQHGGTWVQYGVASFLSGSCGFRSFYERVSLHIDMIEDVINDFQICSELDIIDDKDEGVIVPPVSGGQYLDSTQCSWLLRGAPNTVITIRFEFFDLEDCYYDVYDFVNIYDGNSTSARQVYDTLLCGSDESIRGFESSSNEVLITFLSDGSVGGLGFKINWNIVEDCSPGQFRCWSGESCLDGSLQCDGKSDCADESDEKECAIVDGECGKQDIAPEFLWHARIVGGHLAKNGSWPFLAQIESTFLEDFLCAGTVVNDRWVLTTATCVDSQFAKDLVVTVGTVSFLPSGGMKYKVQLISRPRESILTHPEGAGLLKLSTGIAFSSLVQPACIAIAGSTDEPEPGEFCIALGWGSRLSERVEFGSLRQAQVPIQHEDVCTATRPFGDANSTFCSGDSVNGGVGTCSSDRGGPVMCFRDNVWIQFGIVVRPSCGELGVFDFYTRVSYYTDWIEETMNMTLPKHTVVDSTATTMTTHSATSTISTTSGSTANTSSHPVTVTDESTTSAAGELTQSTINNTVVSTTSAATAVFPAHVLLLTVVLVMID